MVRDTGVAPDPVAAPTRRFDAAVVPAPTPQPEEGARRRAPSPPARRSGGRGLSSRPGCPAPRLCVADVPPAPCSARRRSPACSPRPPRRRSLRPADGLAGRVPPGSRPPSEPAQVRQACRCRWRGPGDLAQILGSRLRQRAAAAEPAHPGRLGQRHGPGVLCSRAAACRRERRARPAGRTAAGLPGRAQDQPARRRRDDDAALTTETFDRGRPRPRCSRQALCDRRAAGATGATPPGRAPPKGPSRGSRPSRRPRVGLGFGAAPAA